VLRGWALFGVLWSNLNDWYIADDPVTRLDHALVWVQTHLIRDRFYTLLCILFGVGFGIQLTRARERGRDITRTYLRRSAALLAIGLLHGFFIWWGDILATYAITSFALVLFRDVRANRILIVSLVIWLFSRDIVDRLIWLGDLQAGPQHSPGAAIFWTLGHGSWFEIHRIGAVFFTQNLTALAGYGPKLAMFLIGLWAVKSGYLARVNGSPRSARRLLYVSAVATALGYVALYWFPRLWPPASLGGPLTVQFWIPRQAFFRMFDWSVVGTALTYGAILILIAQTARGVLLLAPLAVVGRMALTTYLTQSLVCTLIFYGYGFQRFGTARYGETLVVTALLYAAQMALSSWWLRRYAFGPAEWLWRTLTYGRGPVMRRQAPHQ